MGRGRAGGGLGAFPQDEERDAADAASAASLAPLLAAPCTRSRRHGRVIHLDIAGGIGPEPRRASSGTHVARGRVRGREGAFSTTGAAGAAALLAPRARETSCAPPARLLLRSRPRRATPYEACVTQSHEGRERRERRELDRVTNTTCRISRRQARTYAPVRARPPCAGRVGASRVHVGVHRRGRRGGVDAATRLDPAPLRAQRAVYTAGVVTSTRRYRRRLRVARKRDPKKEDGEERRVAGLSVTQAARLSSRSTWRSGALGPNPSQVSCTLGTPAPSEARGRPLRTGQPANARPRRAHCLSLPHPYDCAREMRGAWLTCVQP